MYEEDEMIDMKAVGRLLGGENKPLSKTTIWRMTKDGELPKPIKYGRRIARWKKSDVLAARDRAAKTTRP